MEQNLHYVNNELKGSYFTNELYSTLMGTEMSFVRQKRGTDASCCAKGFARSFAVPLVLMLAGLFPAVPAMAQTLGMVMDNTTNSAIVFDADLDIVLGVVSIPPGLAIGDCSITGDQTLGFATNFSFLVHVIDVPGGALAPGPNPIPISNPGEDTSISPDGNFLVLTNGANSVFPISVVEIATQMQISTINLSGANHNSVDVCSDGSVLATSFDTHTLYRGTIDGGGIITDTEETLAIPEPNNVSCAPGAQAGVVVSRIDTISSFTIPGLEVVDTRALSALGLAAVFNPAGDRVYVRTETTVDVFTFDSATGALGTAPLFTIPGVPVTDSFFGMEQIGIHPNGTKLYVPTPAGDGELLVFDPNTGEYLTTITDLAIVHPTGVCFAPGGPGGLQVDIDIKPGGNPNIINLRSKGVVPVVVFTTDDFDASQVDTLLNLTFAEASPVHCSMADVDEDGDVDLICHFKVQELDLDSSSTEATLEGQTTDDPPVPFTGTDTVTIKERGNSKK